MKDKKTRKSVTVAIHPGFESEQEEDKGSKQEAREMAEAAGVPEEEMRALGKAVSKMHKDVKNLMTEAKMSMIR